MATSNKAAEDKAETPTAPKESTAPLYVDGKKVSEKEYLDAAERSGWDRSYLELYPERRPASISTKKHGE